MKSGTIFGAVAGMLILGGLGFWALGALVEHRIEKRVTTASKPFEKGEPAAILRHGLTDSLRTAEQALTRGDLTSAAAAMDAAKRAADVGKDAVGGVFSGQFEAVRQARLALQNDHVADAGNILSSALDGLQHASPGGTRELSAAAPEYVGATVLNAHGDRIGEVVRVNGTEATLVLGAKRDVLGFLDFNDGEQLSVPLSRLLLGKPKSLGSTMVVLPVLSTPAEKGGSSLQAALD